MSKDQDTWQQGCKVWAKKRLIQIRQEKWYQLYWPFLRSIKITLPDKGNSHLVQIILPLLKGGRHLKKIKITYSNRDRAKTAKKFTTRHSNE